MRLKDNVAIITGAAQGIGAAFALTRCVARSLITGQMIVHDGGLSLY